MARIKSYVQDTNITDQDRILGTSYEGILNNKPIYKTVNYDITALASYFSQNFDFEGVNYNLAEIKDFQINLANSLGDVNLDGSLANISVNFANDLIALVQNTSFPQDLADYIVSIAALNEAFANQVLDLATSTAYATKDSFDSLSAFVDQIDTNVQGLDVSVSNVVADTDANTGAITANATAITALGVRTTTAEADVVALQTDFTSLETIVNDNTDSISANATTISSIGTVIDTATTDIATLKVDVTTLESEIDGVANTASANASDISLLTTNLNTLAGDVTAVQTDVVTLQSDVDLNTDDISSQATALNLLANRVTTAETNIVNASTNITDLAIEVDGNTDAISTTALDVSILQTAVQTAQNDVGALQTNVTLLTTEVDDTAGIAEANAVSISTLSATVNGNTASVSAVSSAVADIEGNLSASYALTVDAGGRVAGLKLLTNGSTGSEFIARANTFGVDMPNGTRVLTVNSSGLSVNGTGTFSGNISGSSGTFNGVTINSSGITASNFSLTSGGLSLSNPGSTINIGGGVIINSSGIAGIGFSLTSSGLSLTSGPTATAISNAQSTANAASIAAGDAEDTANAAQSAANTALGVTNNLTSVVTVTNSKIYQGPGTWGGSTTGFYLDNNGFFSLKDKLTFNASSNTLTVNGSGTFTGTLDAGLVNIANNVISLNSTSSNVFGKLSFKNPSGTEVAKVETFYFTPSGGGISIQGTTGTNNAELRLGSDFNNNQRWSIISSFSSIQGTSANLIFNNSSNRYTFGFINSGSGQTLVRTASGDLATIGSSLRYKENIIDYDKGLETIAQLRPVYFNYKNEKEIQNAGLIAEELDELNLTEFVRYNLEDQPESIAYEQMVTLLIKGMQEQQQQIDALKAEIELLKAQ